MDEQLQKKLSELDLVIKGDLAQSILTLLSGMAVRDGRMCVPDGVSLVQLSAVLSAVRDLQPVQSETVSGLEPGASKDEEPLAGAA